MLTIKKSTALLLAATCIASFWIASCNNETSSKDKVTIDIPKDNSGLDTIHHFIPQSLAHEYLTTFKLQQQDSLSQKAKALIPESEAFNKRALLSLLKAPDCVGLRIFHGIKKGANGARDEIRLVIVGVDSKGNDIYIDDSSILSAKVSGSPVAVENGQCPTCQNVPPPGR